MLPACFKRSSGHTLVELVVASALFLAVLTLTSAIFLASHRLQRRTELQLDMEAQTTLALRTLVSDLSESHYASVQVVGTSLTVLPSPRDASNALSRNAAGQLTWARSVAFRLVSAGDSSDLVRQQAGWPAAEIEPLRPLDAPLVHDAAFWSNLPQHLLAHGVTSLQLEPHNSLGRSWFVVKMRCQQAIDGRTYRLEVQTAVVPRN